MKNWFRLLLLIFSLILTLSLLSACSGKAYEYQFDSDSIKQISIMNSETSEEEFIDSNEYKSFFEELKELNHKSYTGQIKGKELRTIIILLNDDTSYTFEAYLIIRNNSKLKYKCDAMKYNEFLDKYVSN